MAAYGSTSRVQLTDGSPDLLSLIENLPERVLKAAAGYQSKITRYFFEIACLDGLQLIDTTHALPSQLLKYMERAMDLCDEYIHFLLGHLRHHGVRVQCIPECSHCCYNMPTDISIVELIYLYHGLRRSDAADRFFRRCLEVDELWSGITRRLGYESYSSGGSNDREKGLRAYQALERPCPFLQRDRCQVYRYRPLACRMHFSVSPPHWCRPSHFQYSYALAFNFEPWESLSASLEKLNKRFGLDLSDVMIRGLLDLTVNVMEFSDIHWVSSH